MGGDSYGNETFTVDGIDSGLSPEFYDDPLVQLRQRNFFTFDTATVKDNRCQPEMARKVNSCTRHSPKVTGRGDAWTRRRYWIFNVTFSLAM
ncbi:unnamed protein product [Boreogadus saida]